MQSGQSTRAALFEIAENNPVKILRTPFAGLIAILAFLLVTAPGTAPAADTNRTATALPAKSLDEQVQEIKSDVLAIAAELSNLEEKLVYPSNTQVAIFVEVSADQPLPIDSARLSIDGELVAHHIYTFKELEALSKGGVQRIFTGNLPTGQHRLEVKFSGQRGEATGFELAETFAFDKEVDPKLVGITLGAGAVGNPTLAIENW
jgi:hypothetical protein